MEAYMKMHGYRTLAAITAAVCTAAACAGMVFAGGKKDSGAAAQKPKTEIIIAAAASLTDAMNEQIERFAQLPQGANIKVTPTYGASGTLRKQIEQGAPADLFISAAASHMNQLIKEELVDKADCVNMFENKVVVITPGDNPAGITAYEDCASPKVRRIALGIPESVPAGDYAKQVFTSLGIWDTISAKAVFAKDVRQVLTYVEQGEVDAGVVYATDAAISPVIRIIAEAPAGSCKPIIYPGALIKASANKAAAKTFFDFLRTEESGKVFAKYGFAVISAK